MKQEKNNIKKFSQEQKDLLSQFDKNIRGSSKKHSPKSESWVDGVKNFFK